MARVSKAALLRRVGRDSLRRVRIQWEYSGAMEMEKPSGSSTRRKTSLESSSSAARERRCSSICLGESSMGVLAGADGSKSGSSPEASLSA